MSLYFRSLLQRCAAKDLIGLTASCDLRLAVSLAVVDKATVPKIAQLEAIVGLHNANDGGRTASRLHL